MHLSWLVRICGWNRLVFRVNLELGNPCRDETCGHQEGWSTEWRVEQKPTVLVVEQICLIPVKTASFCFVFGFVGVEKSSPKWGRFHKIPQLIFLPTRWKLHKIVMLDSYRWRGRESWVDSLFFWRTETLVATLQKVWKGPELYLVSRLDHPTSGAQWRVSLFLLWSCEGFLLYYSWVYLLFMPANMLACALWQHSQLSCLRCMMNFAYAR